MTTYKTAAATDLRTDDGPTIYDSNEGGLGLKVAGPAGYDYPETIDDESLPSGFRWIGPREFAKACERRDAIERLCPDATPDEIKKIRPVVLAFEGKHYRADVCVMDHKFCLIDAADKHLNGVVVIPDETDGANRDCLEGIELVDINDDSTFREHLETRGFTAAEIELIAYDWSNKTDHRVWAMTKPVEEIRTWIDTVDCSKRPYTQGSSPSFE